MISGSNLVLPSGKCLRVEKNESQEKSALSGKNQGLGRRPCQIRRQTRCALWSETCAASVQSSPVGLGYLFFLLSQVWDPVETSTGMTGKRTSSAHSESHPATCRLKTHCSGEDRVRLMWQPISSACPSPASRSPVPQPQLRVAPSWADVVLVACSEGAHDGTGSLAGPWAQELQP